MQEMSTIESQMTRLGRRRCVPLAALADDSAFGQQCLEQVRLLTAARFSVVTFAGPLKEAASTIRATRNPKLMQQAYGNKIELWDQPPWVGWFIDASQTSPETFSPHLAGGADHGDANHFLLLAISAEAARDTAALGAWRQLAHGREQCRLFWLVVDAESGRTTEHCVLGAVAYLFGGWRRYCETANSHFQKGPVALPLNRDLLEDLDLEISPAVCRPSLEWHSGAWASALSKEIKGLWLRETSEVPELPEVPLEQMAAENKPHGAVPDAQGLLSFLLPERRQNRGYWLEQGESGKPSDQLLVLDDCFVLQHHEDPVGRRQPMWESSRERLAQELSGIKNRHYARQILILQMTAKWILSSRNKLAGLIEHQLEKWLQLPSKPESLLGHLKQRMDLFLSYGKGIESTTSAYRTNIAPFESDADLALRRISAIPQLWGILSILGFIAFVLVSMVLVSSGGGIAGLRGVLGSVLGGGFAVFLAFLVFGAGITILVSEWRAVRALSRLDSTSIGIHRRAVGDLLAKALQQTGREIRKKLDDWVKERDSLRSGLVAREAESSAGGSKENPESFFSETAGMELLEKTKPTLVSRSYNEWREDISGRFFPNFDLAAWQSVLQTSTVRIAGEGLSKITLGEWLAAERPSRQRIEECFTGMIREARQGHHAPPTICFALESWQKNVGTKDTVEIYDAGLPWLVTLALLPPPKGRI